MTVAIVVMVLAIPAPLAYASQDAAGPGVTHNLTVPLQEEEPAGDSELPWLFAVFIITWAAFFGYIFVMSRRQREMRREIETLRLALLEREREASAAGSTSTPQKG